MTAEKETCVCEWCATGKDTDEQFAIADKWLKGVILLLLQRLYVHVKDVELALLEELAGRFLILAKSDEDKHDVCLTSVIRFIHDYIDQDPVNLVFNLRKVTEITDVAVQSLDVDHAVIGAPVLNGLYPPADFIGHILDNKPMPEAILQALNKTNERDRERAMTGIRRIVANFIGPEDEDDDIGVMPSATCSHQSKTIH